MADYFFDLTMGYLAISLMALAGIGIVGFLFTRRFLLLVPVILLAGYWVNVNAIHKRVLLPAEDKTELAAVSEIKTLRENMFGRVDLVKTSKGNFRINEKAGDWENRAIFLRSLTNSSGSFERIQLCSTDYTHCVMTTDWY